ncbi:MAG: hypothetical protein ACOYBM_04755 [Dethiobacteria bacterium]
MGCMLFIHHPFCCIGAEDKNCSPDNLNYIIHKDGSVTCLDRVDGSWNFRPQRIHIYLRGGQKYQVTNHGRHFNFSESPQFLALTALVFSLAKRYGIKFEQITPHDPAFQFPWEEMEWRLFGKLN